MKILLGICILAMRTGAELFVRDVALGLSRRGHSVVVYAPIIGEMVEELRAQSIACVSDLASVRAAPDIIIGNTQVETVLCLASFPDVPAISICHDRCAEHGRPPHFSRIGAYVAVDANCAERLTLEHGIAPSQVSIVQNGVDLQRFRPRPPLPDRPRLAAIFSNYASLGPATEIVRQACAAEGVALEVIGRGSGNHATAPEAILHRYDIVFGKARCAFEAMAVGSAVVVLDQSVGMEGMVTAANVEEWRLWNFGRKLLARHPIEQARVREAVRSYSPADAALVSTYIRSHASLDATVDALEKLALEILGRRTSPIAPEREWREFADYVNDFLLAPSPTKIAHQVGLLQQELLGLQEAMQALHAQHHAAQVARQEADQARLRAESGLVVARDKLARSRQKLAAVRSTYSWRTTRPFRWLGKRLVSLRARFES